MKKLVLLIISLPIIITTQAVEYAWWVTFKHEPSKTELYNNDLSKNYSEFSHIEIFTCDTDDIFTREQCEEIKQNKGKFILVGDFNSDGKNEVLSIGVAKYVNGLYTNVIVVQDEKSLDVTQLLTLDREEPGFAIFFDSPEGLSIYFCMECGDYADLTWLKNKWIIKWPEPYG